MIFQKAAFRLAVLHQVLGSLAGEPFDEHRMISSASGNNVIHLERDVNLRRSTSVATVDIFSNVPVTVQRYGDSGGFPMVGRPVIEGMARVLVTSNCNTDETQVVPEVTASPTGAITVAVDVSEADGAAMKFLEPSSFSAFWTSVSSLCRGVIRAAGSEESRVLQETTCEVGTSGDASQSCGQGQFCQLDAGVCGISSAIQIGVCQPKPDMCTMNFAPVCGCDGETYTNDCAAHEAGTSVSYEGDCDDNLVEQSVGSGMAECQVGDGSCGVGQFCELDEGVCDDSSTPGVCRTKPDFCYEIWQPVCGCNGETYDNDCYAQLAGVSISRKGECDAQTTVDTEMDDGTDTNECEIGPSAETSNSCSKGQFCLLAAGVCDTSSDIQTGVCQAKPEVCTMNFMPVCGCDGKTYSNDCVAHEAGTSVSYEGECDAKPTDLSVGTGMAGCQADGGTCETGQFCELDEGVCDDSSTTGVCRTKPDVCYEIWQPVCGCDGETYDNDCYAQLAGVSISRKGECDAQTGVDTEMDAGTETFVCEVDSSTGTSKSCIKGQFCLLAAGICDTSSAIQTGVCQAKPEVCTMNFMPVCGCDRKTYSNDCVAHEAGTSVSYNGECDAKPADPSIGTGISGCKAGDGTCGEGQFCQLDHGVCGLYSILSSTGVCQTKPEVCDLNYEPFCGCDGETYDNGCFAKMAGISVSHKGECATKATIDTETVIDTTAGNVSITAATTVLSSDDINDSTPAESEITNAAPTVATDAAINGDSPTESPAIMKTSIEEGPPTPSPTNFGLERDPDNTTSPGSAFKRQCSSSFHVAITLMLIAVNSGLICGNRAGNLWRFGKFTVTAMAISSLRPKGAGVRGGAGSNSHLVSQNEHVLPTCTFNVEVLIDGCGYPLEIVAPSARVIDAVVKDVTQQQRPGDTCVTDYEATVTVPAAGSAIELDLPANRSVQPFHANSDHCLRPSKG